MAEPLDLSFDVTTAWGTGEEVTQAAWLFLPTSAQPPLGLLCCFSGGTYDKHYWHLSVPDHPDYSFAEHLADRGFAVIAIDHLGVGDSSRPSDVEAVRLARVAQADADVVNQIRRRITDKTLHPDLPGDGTLPVIGVGHSMGAALTIIAQAESAVFDAVAILGLSVDITHVLADLAGSELPQDMEARLARSAQAIRAVAEATWDDGYIVMDRTVLRPYFHGGDVPAAVIAADDAVQSQVPKWCAVETGTAGLLTDYARKVDVPVLIAFGDRDYVVEHPRREPAVYANSQQVTLLILPNSGHCHNFAGTRRRLWDHIAHWAAGIATESPLAPVAG